MPTISPFLWFNDEADVPGTQNAAILSDAAFAHLLLTSSLTQERATGLEPATSSLGS